ncbi:hypothetical protein MANES_16G042260v8 [Manihot esculenta]|uniref:Uncharacterized protein n=1 Tax=Manihot esculenta TaxID=3983 RepID=A0ACB7G5G9_MANES|nr:hypothetical protein MANES_16G042260v8 [Manihot esculenta]
MHFCFSLLSAKGDLPGDSCSALSLQGPWLFKDYTNGCENMGGSSVFPKSLQKEDELQM